MKGELYAPGQPIKEEDLNYEKFSLQDSLSERILDLYTPGVLRGSQELAETVPFQITSGGGLFINVGSGVAIAAGAVDSSDPTKTGGERIHIPLAETLSGQNYRRFAGGWPGAGGGTGPYFESPDGLGGYAYTPQSTLTRLIPVTDATTNYVWIGYLHAVDPAVRSIHKVSSRYIYPRGLDGYDIIVTTSATPPSFNGNVYYMLLGTVTTSGGVITAIDQSMMAYARTNANRVGFTLDTSSPPATYANGESKFIDEHINAMGTGVLSPSNPHKMSPEDIGLVFDNIDLVGHRKDHHTNGLVGNPLVVTSGLTPATDAATPDPSPAVAMVYLKKMVSGESLVVSGLRFVEVSPSLVAPVGSASVGDSYVSFLSTDSPGTYYIYIGVSGGVATLYRSLSLPTSGVFLVGSVGWSGSEFNTAITDSRLFGLTGTKDIQSGAVVTESIADSAVTSIKISSGSVDNSKVSSSAAIAYSKLNLSGGIVDSDVSASANIAYSKLSLSGSIVASDLSANSVSTSNIQDSSVTTLKLASDVLSKLMPAGVVLPFAGTEANKPDGFDVCDGHALDGSNPLYSALYAAIGTTWGVGTGAPFSFNVPDLRGVFLRGVNSTSAGASIDGFKDDGAETRTKRDGTSPSSGVGSFQIDTFQDHTHPEYGASGAGSAFSPGGFDSPASTALSFSVAANSGNIGSETVPRNAAILYIIKL